MLSNNNNNSNSVTKVSTKSYLHHTKATVWALGNETSHKKWAQKFMLPVVVLRGQIIMNQDAAFLSGGNDVITSSDIGASFCRIVLKSHDS